MPKSKTLSLDVNDVFDELKQENIRLYKQISFIGKFRQLLDKFSNNLKQLYDCCECQTNHKNRYVFSNLRKQYQTVNNQFECILGTGHQNQEIFLSTDNCLITVNRCPPIDKTNDTSLQTISDNPISESVKTEVILESEEDFAIETKVSNDSDGEDFSINDHNSKTKKKSEQPFDSSVYLDEGSKSDYLRICGDNSSGTAYFVCNYIGCNVRCLRTDKMQKHIEIFHLNRKPLKCESCHQIYWRSKLLAHHIQEDHKHLIDSSTGKFLCAFDGCRSKFKTINLLCKHNTRHNSEKLFKCSDKFPECQWSFFTAGELRNHQVAIHSCYEYFCDWVGCGEGFKIKCDLDLHKLQKHNNTDETKLELMEKTDDPFNSDVPDRTFLKIECETNYSIVKHQNTNKIRYFICNYNYCEFKCSVVHKMERHITELHLSKSPISCNACEQLFWSHKLLTNHIRRDHPNIFDPTTQLYKCTFKDCGLTFDRYSKVLFHQKRHFSGKSFKCSDTYPKCHWTFYTSGELKNHQMWTHSAEHPFVCDWDGCNKKFKLKNLLNDHKLRHTPEMLPLKCEWPGCEMRYSRNNSLKVHMETHIGSRDFICDWPECEMTFRTNSSLMYHYATHTNNKRHRCNWPGCEYSCISSSSLVRHKLVHQEVGSHECVWPNCHKRFKTKFTLNVHHLAHKGVKPFKCESHDCDMRFTEKKQMRKHYRRIHLHIKVK